MKTELVPAGIQRALDRIRAAWDAGDADAYAAQFTDDANYVIFAGLVSRGRSEIRADHVPVFEKWQRGTLMSMKVIDVRLLGDDAAVVLTEGGIGKRPPISHDKVQTFVFVREDERWLCAAFQNTKRNRILAAINAREKQRLTA
ncbi:MAG TPA: SgcJ/EcaC family oxidoreductase [Microbacterium sp.]|nr:SgcJ/EcaC family oxidoreductase [Microbacterium sp.]